MQGWQRDGCLSLWWLGGLAWPPAALAALGGSCSRTIQGPGANRSHRSRDSVPRETSVPVTSLRWIPSQLLPSQGPCRRQLSLLGTCPDSQPSPHPWAKQASSTHGQHVSMRCIPGMPQLLPLETSTPSMRHVQPLNPDAVFPLHEEHGPRAGGAQPCPTCRPPCSKFHIAK